MQNSAFPDRCAEKDARKKMPGKDARKKMRGKDASKKMRGKDVWKRCVEKIIKEKDTKKKDYWEEKKHVYWNLVVLDATDRSNCAGFNYEGSLHLAFRGLCARRLTRGRFSFLDCLRYPLQHDH